jgi:hypothetical protein
VVTRARRHDLGDSDGWLDGGWQEFDQCPMGCLDILIFDQAGSSALVPTSTEILGNPGDINGVASRSGDQLHSATDRDEQKQSVRIEQIAHFMRDG